MLKKGEIEDKRGKGRVTLRVWKLSAKERGEKVKQRGRKRKKKEKRWEKSK